MTRRSVEGDIERESALSVIHAPDGPPVGAQFDPALAKLRDEQVAAREHAAGQHSVDSVLNVNAPLPYSVEIEAEMKVLQAESLVARDTADEIGSAMVFEIKTAERPRSVPENETANEARLRTSPLPKVERELERKKGRRTTILQLLAVYAAYLGGMTTDGTGRNLAARVPSGSYHRRRRFKFWTKAMWVPLDLGILYFTLRLLTRTEPGPFQLVQEIIETISLVGLSALIMMVTSNLLADAIARLRRHPDASREGEFGRWFVALLLGVFLVGLALLLAWVRAAYLSGGITANSELPLPYQYFFLISVVWLLAPGVMMCVIVLFGHYNNEYVDKTMQLNEELVELDIAVDDVEVEHELRNDSILLQEERRRLALDEHDVARTVIIPATMAHRKAAFLAELARLKGDPTFTEAIVAYRQVVGVDNVKDFDDPIADLIAARKQKDAKRPSLGSQSRPDDVMPEPPVPVPFEESELV